MCLCLQGGICACGCKESGGCLAKALVAAERVVVTSPRCLWLQGEWWLPGQGACGCRESGGYLAKVLVAAGRISFEGGYLLTGDIGGISGPSGLLYKKNFAYPAKCVCGCRRAGRMVVTVLTWPRGLWLHGELVLKVVTKYLWTMVTSKPFSDAEAGVGGFVLT